MKKSTTILYIVNAHLPNVRANGIQIAHTCEALGKHTRLTLVTRSQGDAPSIWDYYHLEKSFTHKTLPTIDISWLPFRYIIRNFIFFVVAQIYIVFFWLSACVRREPFAVYVRGELVLACIPLSYFIPIFFETHQIRNLEWAYRIALRACRGIIVITERLKKKFVDEYLLPENKILVARDSVDVHVFDEAIQDRTIWSSYGIRAEKKIVLYSGTLAPEKGVDTLAESASYLPDNVQIVFLGGTEEQIFAFKNRYGHIQNISIVGRVNYVDVPRHVVSADVLILPDSAEFTYSNLYTSPMKLFEYMASNRPIVASKVPSLCEVLDDSTATFFEAGNAKSLAESIEKAIEEVESSQIKAKTAYEQVSQFTWEKRGKAIFEHITGCLEG